MEKKRYSEALSQYRAALGVDPDEPTLLYDAGLAAYLSKDYSSAAPFWVRFVQIVPDDWRVRAKLVQTYQALSDLKARDDARQALFKLRAGRKLPELNAQQTYCREQFEVDGQPVFAYEFFELTGSIATRYKFVVVDEKSDSEKYRIDLESDAFDNDLAKEAGELKSGERIFTLDGYYSTRGRLQTQKLFAFYKNEPTYEATRADVVGVIQGRLKSGVGTTYPSSSH